MVEWPVPVKAAILIFNKASILGFYFKMGLYSRSFYQINILD
jgi:hypothetical protein